jgi:hypothetical protein
MTLVAQTVADGKVTNVALRLADSEPADAGPKSFADRVRRFVRRIVAALR